MKIPNSLSQYKTKNILMLVTGKQNAALYHIHDDTIDEVLKFVTLRPQYADNEGVFQASVNGAVHSGSTDIYRDEDMIRDFIHEFKDKTKNLKLDFAEIYFFAPGSSRAKIKESLSKEWRDKITKVEDGNYFHETPLDILEKISKKDRQVFQPLTREEQKIFSVPRY